MTKSSDLISGNKRNLLSLTILLLVNSYRYEHIDSNYFHSVSLSASPSIKSFFGCEENKKLLINLCAFMVLLRLKVIFASQLYESFKISLKGNLLSLL